MEPIDPSHRPPSKRSHRITLIGFALLCISFVLPFPAIYVPVYITEVGPGPGVTQTIRCYGEGVPTQDRPGMSPAAVAFGEGHAVRYFLGPGFPFVLGVAGLCLCLFRRPTRAPQIVFGILLIWAAGVTCAAIIRFADAIMEVAFGDGYTGAPHSQTSWIDITPTFVVLGAMILIAGFGCGAMIFARRNIRRPLGAVCCGLISLPVFVLHILDMTHGFYIGPYVSALGCVLVIIGGVREALAAARAARRRLAFRR